MKTRNVFAGAVVGALAVGIWLGSFWKGPGLGGLGTGFGTGNGEENTQPVSLDSVHVSSNVESSVERAPAQSEPMDELPTDMMTVVIDGGNYRLVAGETSQAGKRVSLEEVLEHARKMTGTAEGIRVRILKAKSAQEGARADLMKALAADGVKREEIQERAEFVD